jgi:hypothetical protein
VQSWRFEFLNKNILKLPLNFFQKQRKLHGNEKEQLEAVIAALRAEAVKNELALRDDIGQLQADVVRSAALKNKLNIFLF